jgi:hypothetical protein
VLVSREDAMNKKAISVFILLLITAMLVGAGPERLDFTIKQINNGVLEDKIVFNAISDNPNIGHEFNFVGARERGLNNLWYDTINVEPDKTYFIRIYVHNNSHMGYDAVAEDVIAKFNVPTTVGKLIEVNGFLYSSNATPKEIWDNVFFQSDKEFHLEYVTGSAKFENNGVGSGGVSLDDSIVTSTGVLLGYEQLNGQIPGGFQYNGYVTILVKPIFTDTTTEVAFYFREYNLAASFQYAFRYFISFIAKT